MSNNKNLIFRNNGNSNDEIYTTAEQVKFVCDRFDFTDKVIYCPCDTPDSEFVKYFKNKPEIKKLYHTSIQEGVPFQSDYAKELASKSDIIVTNPPFSVLSSKEWVDFVHLAKQYIFFGTLMLINYKHWTEYLNELYFERITLPYKNGMKLTTSGFYTNIYIDHPQLKLKTKFSDNNYCYEDKTGFLYIEKVKNIPCDYFEPMLVPLSFIEEHCKGQFEIIGNCRPLINNKAMFARIIIQRVK